MSPEADPLSWTTRLLTADEAPDDDGAEDDLSVSPPLHQSVNFRARGADHLHAIARPLGDRYYTRRGNPTASRLVRVLADLEGAESGLFAASGMGAMATSVLALVKAGDHVIGQRNHYIGITQLLDRVLPGFGVETTRVDQRDPAAFAAALRPNTRLILLETPVNPMMHVTDLAAVTAIARERGITTLCDGTFATPVNQRPLALGVDLVMHSVTKYIGGHHDLLAGAVLGRSELVERVWDMSLTLGAIGAPFNAWLALRGVRTLGLRMARHNANGLALAQWLERHPAVAQVHYPGLASHPQHALAARQMSGYGGLLTFDLKGGRRAAFRCVERLKCIRLASSLGGVGSTAIPPAALFGEQLPEAMLAEQGITPGLVRLAAGIENAEDLVADLEQALAGQA